ncbi:hypothetical protein [Streptomyces sp. NPDC007063]|uniref:hypothetical protein n=1 Tax=Streptomyces sp. NPDC007063 TaxID=3364772 RepID=UPI00367848EF
MDEQAIARAMDSERLLGERASEAFTEVQRADTKATTLCGLAGGLLTLTGTVLVQAQDRSWVLVYGLAAVCSLLTGAVVAALGALRPVLPRAGLPAVLAAEAGCGEGGEHGRQAVEAGTLSLTGAAPHARRLRVMAALAGRKLRAVRLDVDLVRTALVVAGLALLIGYLAF